MFKFFVLLSNFFGLESLNVSLSMVVIGVSVMYYVGIDCDCVWVGV